MAHSPFVCEYAERRTAPADLDVQVDIDFADTPKKSAFRRAALCDKGALSQVLCIVVLCIAIAIIQSDCLQTLFAMCRIRRRSQR